MRLSKSPNFLNESLHWRKTTLVLALLGMSACSTVGSVASGVASGTAKVAVGTVSAVGTVVGTAAGVAYDGVKIVAGGVVSGVAAGAVATVVVVKNVTVNTTLLAINTAISAASLIGNIVVWGIALSRDKDDNFHTMLMHIGPNTFQSNEGRIIRTSNCPAFEKSLPALLVINKKGESEIRVAGKRCNIEQVERLA